MPYRSGFSYYTISVCPTVVGTFVYLHVALTMIDLLLVLLLLILSFLLLIFVLLSFRNSLIVISECVY